MTDAEIQAELQRISAEKQRQNRRHYERKQERKRLAAADRGRARADELAAQQTTEEKPASGMTQSEWLDLQFERMPRHERQPDDPTPEDIAAFMAEGRARHLAERRAEKHIYAFTPPPDRARFSAPRRLKRLSQ